MSEPLSHLLAQHAPHPLVVLDVDLGHFVEVNELAVACFGYSRDELLRMHPNDLTVPESLRALEGKEPLARALAGETVRFRVLKRRKDGSTFPCMVNLRRIPGQRRLVAGSMLDRTEIERARGLLEESAEQLRALLRQGFHGTFVHEGGRIVQADAEVERLLGYEPGELEGKDAFEFLAPQDHARIAEQLLAPVSTPLLCTLVRKDGGRLAAETVGADCAFQGRPARVVGVRDLELHRLEKARTQEQEGARLRRRRLEALGALAGGIAHDFNNLLVQIIANLELVDEPQSEPFGEARRAAQQAADLARQLLAYSGKGRFVVEVEELSELVRCVGQLLAEVVPRDVELRFDLARPSPRVAADRTQLEQLLVQLVTNAVDACAAGGGVVIATGQAQLDQATLSRAWLGDALQPGPAAWLEVRDSGEGMDLGTRARMFEPYFSSRSDRSGLGLAVVLGIARGHGAAIEVSSEQGAGTTVRVWWPLAHPVERSEPAPAPQLVAGGLVLVVDDESGVRSVARRCLKRAGFEVVEARDGLEALRLFEEHEAVDLVLLDLTMPRLDGLSTLARLRELDPEVRVLLTSGFSEHEVHQQLAGRQQARFLPKPWTSEELLAMVRRALAG